MLHRQNQCSSCRLMLPTFRCCLAFGTKIPDEIWEDRVKHDKPYPGDHGLQHTPGRNIFMESFWDREPMQPIREAGWEEEEHPRAPAGSEEGGQFVAKGEGGTARATAIEEGLPVSPEGDEPPEGYVRLYRGVNPERNEFAGDDDTHGGWYTSSYETAVSYANWDYEGTGELGPNRAVLAVDVPLEKAIEFAKSGSRINYGDDEDWADAILQGTFESGDGVEMLVDNDAIRAAQVVEGDKEVGRAGMPKHEARARTSKDSPSPSYRNDRFVQCELGHDHWGAAGAAGMLFRSKGADGQTRYYLQHRGAGVQHGNTWSIPGGAIDEDESPEDAADREAAEEIGRMPGYRVANVAKGGCPGWTYHTVIADVDEEFEAPTQNWEHTGGRWVTAEEMGNLPLHPAFRRWAAENIPGFPQEAAFDEDDLAPRRVKQDPGRLDRFHESGRQFSDPSKAPTATSFANKHLTAQKKRLRMSQLLWEQTGHLRWTLLKLEDEMEPGPARDKKRRAVLKELNRARREIRRLSQQDAQAGQKSRQDLRKRLGIAGVAPDPPAFKWDGPSEHRGLVDGGLSLVSPLLGNRVRKEIEDNPIQFVARRPGDSPLAQNRSFYRRGEHRIYLATQGQANPAAVSHEVGHWLEMEMPDWHEKCQDFMASRIEAAARAKGIDPSKPVALRQLVNKLKDIPNYRYNGYNDREWFFNVDIAAPYATSFRWTANASQKQIDNSLNRVDTIRNHLRVVSPREIVSTGIEKMILEPVKFAHEDPEYFEFMVNLLQEKPPRRKGKKA